MAKELQEVNIFRSCVNLISFLILSWPMWVYSQSLYEQVEGGDFERLMDMAPNTQFRATLNTFFGRSDLNDELKNLPLASRNCPTEGFDESPGKDWVLSHVRASKVLMFNENHIGVEPRAFLRMLLPELRNLGFTHIGFETFLPPNAEYEYGMPYTPASGFYSLEPLFASLVREAAALGFEIFGYESIDEVPVDADESEGIRIRETGQAANIRARIESADQSARFIIFAGGSHIAKEPIPGRNGESIRWMAARLKDSTGIDPFTIDLTGCVYESEEPEGWRGRIYMTEEGTALVHRRNFQAYNAQIHLPVPPRNRPQAASFFRQSLGEPVTVPTELRVEDEPVLVQAHKQPRGPLDDVAHDRILLYPGEDLPLYLPSGSYVLTSYRRGGNVVGRVRIEVD